MQPYLDSYSLERKTKDSDMWLWWGSYGLSAISTAIEHCFCKKPKGKYIEKPIMQAVTTQLDAEEIERQRNAFMSKMRTMKINWDLAHKEE